MATLLENLITRRDAIGAELAAMSSATAGGLPNASKSGVDHQTYKMNLYRELEEIEKRIAASQGPFEIVSEGVT